MMSEENRKQSEEHQKPNKSESHLFEGEFMAKQVKPEIGSYNGKKKVRVSMRITSPGDRLGRVLDYEGQLDDKNIKYTKRAMIALGWKGVTVSTFVDDVTKADREVPITVRIAQYTKDNGEIRRWSSIDRIGNFAPPLEKLDDDGVRSMDSWFAEAGDVGAPSNGANGAPPISDQDLPF